MTVTPWPTQIRLKDKGKQLEITFDESRTLRFSSEFLRVMSPSAEVQGHSADQRKVISGKKEIAIIKVDPVGNYAIKPTFDDMHSTGIYTWAYFLELEEQRDFLWKRYVQELQDRNLTREA